MEFLLPVILTCSQAKLLVERVRSKHLTDAQKIELVKELKAISPKSCKW